MRQRGASGTLKMLLWQAPTSLNPYLSQGVKDLVASRCCLEPLLTVDNTGQLTPVLAAEVPSQANGGLPDDRTVVYRLRPGVTWADGTPFTARGFERVPTLDHLQSWLLELMPG